MQPNRRAFITGAAGLTLLLGSASQGLFAKAAFTGPIMREPLGGDPFTLGIASGDPWPDGFVIWTRLALRPLDEHGGMPAARIPVRWEVAEDEGFTRVVRRGEAMAKPELGHSVHVEVAGLKPHRPYFYRFATAGSAISRVGTVRTAPERHVLAQRLRIGVAGCQHYEQGFYDAWSHLAQEPDLDLIFHYGDYIYENGRTALGPRAGKWTAVRQHVGDEIYSLDDYRRRYAQYKTDPALQAAHAACAFACSIDDHEVDDNFAGDIDRNGSSPEVFALRRMGAMQAWYENMPVRRAQFPMMGRATTYRRLDFGRLLRTHILDTRSYRSDQVCDDGKRQPCARTLHMAPNMLGHAQEAWLDEGLTPVEGQSPTWNLLAQQVIVMPVDYRTVGSAGGKYNMDSWDGYRPARARLIETIQRHALTNVIIATGDAHSHMIGSVPGNDEAPDGRKVAVEFQVASISSGGNGAGAAGAENLLRHNPHIDLYTDSRGYQLFDITPEEWRTEVKVMDGVEQPGGHISTLQKYVVAPSSPVLHRN